MVGKHRKTERLGRSDFESEHAGESLPSTEDARALFLDAVRNLEPSVLDDLSGEPYQLYQQTDLYFESSDKRTDKQDLVTRHLWNSYQRPSWQQIETPPPTNHPLINYRQFWECSPVETDPHILMFRRCLIEWSRDHKLDEVWCRERAYETLDRWCFSPESYKSRFWIFEIAWPHPFMIGFEPCFNFSRKTQYPLINSHKDELEAAVEEFRRQYDAFLTKFNENAEASGLKASPVKPLGYHFEWLVRRHVQEWDYEEIAEHYKKAKAGWDKDENRDKGVDESHIRHKIPEIARLIGLRLKNRRGRPRKS